MYKGRTKNPVKGRMCICRCPNWCELGYQIAQWDGEKFDFPESPNPWFDRDVIAWMPLDEDGEPLKII